MSLVEFIPSFSRGVSTSTARSCRTREECCKFDTPSPASDHRFDYLPLIDCAYGCAEQCLLVTVTVPLRSIGMFTSRQVLRFHQHVGCLLQVKSPFGGGDADGGQGECRHWVYPSHACLGIGVVVPIPTFPFGVNQHRCLSPRSCADSHRYCLFSSGCSHW